MQAPLDHIGNIAQPGCDMWMSIEELLISSDTLSGSNLGQTRGQMLGIVYAHSDWTGREDRETNSDGKLGWKIDSQHIRNGRRVGRIECLATDK